jgi:hypothetical protein
MSDFKEIVQALKAKRSELSKHLELIDKTIAGLSGVESETTSVEPLKKRGPKPGLKAKRKAALLKGKRGFTEAENESAPVVETQRIPKGSIASKFSKTEKKAKPGRKAKYNVPGSFNDAKTAAEQTLFVLNSGGKMKIAEIINSISKYENNPDLKKIEANVRAAVRALKLKGVISIVAKEGREEVFQIKN